MSEHSNESDSGSGSDDIFQSDEELYSSTGEEEEPEDEDEDEDEEALSRHELIAKLRRVERELRVRSNEFDTFLLEMTRRLSQLNAQLHKDAEGMRHKDKEIELFKEKNETLSDLLRKKEESYEALSTEHANDQSYLMETLTKYEFLLNSLSEVQAKENSYNQVIDELKGKLISLREISVQLQQDKESLRIKLTAKDKQLNRAVLKFNEVKTILDSATSELETVRQERDNLLSVRGETADSIKRSIEVEQQETLSLQLQNNLLKQDLENMKKVTEKQKSISLATERELLGKSRVVDALDLRLTEYKDYEILDNGRSEMIELMGKSEQASEERLDMVINELRRSKELLKSLQNRITDYESLMLSDQSTLNELYLTFSKEVLEKEMVIAPGTTDPLHPLSSSLSISSSEVYQPQDTDRQDQLVVNVEDKTEGPSNQLELLKADSVGELKQQMAEKQEQIDYWKHEILKMEEANHWSQARIDLSEKNLSITKKQLEESAALIAMLSQERERATKEKFHKHEPLEAAELERMVTDLQLSCLTHQKRNNFLTSEVQRLEEELAVSNTIKRFSVDKSIEKDTKGPPTSKNSPPTPSKTESQPASTLTRSSSTPSFTSFTLHLPSSFTPQNQDPPISISPRLSSSASIVPLVPTPSFVVTPPSPRLNAREAPPPPSPPFLSTLTRSVSTPNFFDLSRDQPPTFSPLSSPTLPKATANIPIPFLSISSDYESSSPPRTSFSIPRVPSLSSLSSVSSNSGLSFTRSPSKELLFTPPSTPLGSKTTVPASPSLPQPIRPSPPLLLPRQEVSVSPPSSSNFTLTPSLPALTKDKFPSLLQLSSNANPTRSRRSADLFSLSPPSSPSTTNFAKPEPALIFPSTSHSPTVFSPPSPFVIHRNRQPLPSSPFILPLSATQEDELVALPTSFPSPLFSSPLPLYSSPTKLSRAQSLDAISTSSIELLPLQAAKQRIRELESTITFPIKRRN